MTKRFEGELSRTLDALIKLEGYKHKCPDSPYGGADRIDFITQTLDAGQLLGIEAKETTTKETLPWNNVTPNQQETLRRINVLSVGLLVVNFNRSHDPTTRRPGVIGIYRWPFLSTRPLAPMQRMAWDLFQLPEQPSLRLDWADATVEERAVGGLWLGLEPYLRSEWWES